MIEIDLKDIPPNEIDTHIDNAKSLIDETLLSTVTELQITKAQTRKVDSWYSQHTAKTVYDSVTNGTWVKQDKILSDIKTTNADINPEDGSYFFTRIQNIMNARPTAQKKFKDFFFGTEKRNKLLFLIDLRNNGESVLKDAAAELSESQSHQKETERINWERLRKGIDFYYLLTNAVTTNTAQNFLGFLKSDKRKILSSEIMQELLMMPIGEHKNALLAIAQIKTENSAQKSELIEATLNILGNSSESLKTIEQAIPDIKDADAKKQYQAYLDKFTPAPIPTPVQVPVQVQTEPEKIAPVVKNEFLSEIKSQPSPHNIISNDNKSKDTENDTRTSSLRNAFSQGFHPTYDEIQSLETPVYIHDHPTLDM